MRRRVLIILMAAAAIAAIGGVWWYRTQQLAAEAASTEVRREAIVQRGTLVSTVRVSGMVEPEEQVSLNFGAAGTLAEVNVEPGQVVKQGDVLARLDTLELELAIAQAEKVYLIQQLNYSLTVAGPAPEDVAAAEALLASAQAQYADVKGGLKADQRAQLEAQLVQARAQLQIAQDAHDGSMKCVSIELPTGDESLVCPGLGPFEEQARSQLQVAQAAFDAAQASYDRALGGASSAQLSAALAQVEQARANLARLAPDADRVAVARAQVEQARISLEQARLRLDKAAIVAPFDGIVAEVNLTRGEVVGSSASLRPAIVLADLSRFHVDVSVDEIDVGRLQVGQAVSVTLDALPGETLAGQVERIAPLAVVEGAIVLYKVRVGLQPSQLPLRAGMSASLSIVTESYPDVLLVPNWAIRIERTTGKSYVNLKQGQAIREVEIVSGARNETYSQVVSGLSEGDQVVAGGVAGLRSMIESMESQ